jgi:hypothetical protein
MDNIFHINHQKKQNEKKEEYYTVVGEQDFFKDKTKIPCLYKEEKSLAKKITNLDTNSSKYYIKVGMYGRPYNPIGMYSEGQSAKFLTKAGKPQYTFKEVNEKTFSFYINFLTTKNTAWLSNTERELQ